ncbi:MbtH-like protein [Caballeronia glathei]|uniref:MbtH family protein n=1 Tax=Caballeronia glathei TaxID=60547 RepID=UPI000507C284|nr:MULTISPECIES: MbtH family NRPS accessory protein [Burkholderiaceae]TCK33782.1 MbtH protein [Paraburkholderia sp. BL8N3]CDY78873.1 MbtH-like protein [Caballeronia glathei]
MQESNETPLFRVVANHEDQYSVWLADLPVPAGWRDAGKIGDREACLRHINEVWTDMRPASLRVLDLQT